MVDWANIKIRRETLRRLHLQQAQLAVSEHQDLTLSDMIDLLLDHFPSAETPVSSPRAFMVRQDMAQPT